MNIARSFSTALVTLLISSIAHAGVIYEYSIDNPPGSQGAGDLKNVSARYDANTQQFDWSYTIGKKHGSYSDGFWLVVTDGENPKNDVNEYAIIYGDLAADILTVYEYSGQNNAGSYNSPGNLIDYKVGIEYSDDNTAHTRTVSFSLDASTTNSFYDNGIWKGLNFGEHIGIWFHPVLGLNSAYSDDHSLSSFKFAKQSWFDIGYGKTTEVPEPSTVALFVIGLLGLGVARRRIHA